MKFTVQQYAAAVSLAVVALVVGSVSSQCGPNGCAIPSRVVAQPTIPTNEQPVYVNGKQVGSVDKTRRVFQPYDSVTDTWGPVVHLDAKGWIGAKGCKCDRCECAPVGDVGDWRENGVHSDKVKPARTTINGYEVWGNVGDSVPDDSKKLTVTLIGAKADRDKTAAELRSSPDADRFNVWSVSADHHSLKDTETGKTIPKTDGSPTVYVQAPDGRVLHRQDDGKDVVGAVRKAVKGYDSAKDPDLRKHDPVSPATPIPSALPICCLIALGALVVFNQSKKP